jgi:zinc transport system permease protein
MLISAMLQSPFMQRALIAGLILGVLLASLGTFVTLRKMAFFGDGIAHSSLAGIAIALLLGLSPLPTALAWAVVIAISIYLLEHRMRLSSDTLVGIFFPAGMALGVVLMSMTRGYQPDLFTYLFGSILSVRPADLAIIAGCAAAILAWLASSYRELTFMSLAEESAEVAGVPVYLHTPILYVALALATVLGVKILGIILVSALLVLPSAVSRLLATSFKEYLFASVALAEAMIVAGLAISFAYDLPSGATIILVGTAVFFLVTAARALAAKRKPL